MYTILSYMYIGETRYICLSLRLIHKLKVGENDWGVAKSALLSWLYHILHRLDRATSHGKDLFGNRGGSNQNHLLARLIKNLWPRKSIDSGIESFIVVDHTSHVASSKSLKLVEMESVDRERKSVRRWWLISNQTAAFDLARSLCLYLCNLYVRTCSLITTYIFANWQANLSGCQTLGAHILGTPSIQLGESCCTAASAKIGKVSAPMNPLDSEFWAIGSCPFPFLLERSTILRRPSH